MRKILVVVDMQNDFTDGVLGTKEAVDIIPEAVKKIKSFDGDIFVTFDTHSENYLETAEGKKLPVPHCIKGTDGWELNKDIKNALCGKKYVSVQKPSFGSLRLPELVKEAVGNEDFSVELIGLCTDICVVSNALILKANFPEVSVAVCEKCCAGVTPEKHRFAVETMRSCQIDII